MTVRRRAGAPRLIEWTGERCVPWAPDVQVVYEHFHRYLWASELVRGRRVLDLASGEGFGAAILAGVADAVTGVDIDPTTVEHAKRNYKADNLTFAVADARALTAVADDAFDAVVAFELIEHIEQQDRVLDEAIRVLAPGGLLIISTPDRDAYAVASPGNPFHVRELSRSEFTQTLAARFSHTAIFGQHTVTGSALVRLDAAASPSAGESRTGQESRAFLIERAGEDWAQTRQLSPLYLVAVASDAALPDLASSSSLSDGDMELVRAAVSGAQAELERRAAELEALTAKLQAREREHQRLRARAAHDAHTISSLDAALNAANHKLRRVEGSVTWQLIQRIRGRLFALLGGEDSPAVDRLQRSLRYLGRKLRMDTAGGVGGRPAGLRRRARRELGPITLPSAAAPEVSIVIPLYAQADLTRAALQTIRDCTDHVQYEVILVDDQADPATKALLKQVHGAQVLVNEDNIGYLRSVQRGAGAARGRWLVLCNNDIEVEPGWLSALLDCGDSEPDIAIVAPKYLSPDGSLSEAGGVIWQDGTGCNYGRGEDPSSCHFEYRREIDYGSAAALLVRADFWNEVGGFDERFEPMYYEDTDLCFEARARGLRVMYEPRARVVHIEGATAGTDESSGHKRHQERNRPKFVQKWRDRLESEHLPSGSDPWLGAAMRCRERVLVADHRVPMWDRESGALRMRGILEALRDHGCHVTFLADNQLATQPYTRELQRIGIEVLYGVDPRTELTRIAPHLSLAILSRPEVAVRWLAMLREHAPDARLVYDTVDLHWLREARGAAARAGSDGEELVFTPKAAAMRELELGLIRASDATVVVTDSERDKVRADVPDAVVHVVPNVNPVRAQVPPAELRGGVLFVGGFEHPPNTDAALVLVREVMPLVWHELPDVVVTIVGADPPPEVAALEAPRVRVAGWVPDLDPLLDGARALVAPLTYGAGLKGKVTQALAVGLPVVTTPVGAEGLDAADGEQMLIGNDPEELAARVIRVLTDGALWTRLSTAGQTLAAGRCSPAVMGERVGQLLTSDQRPDSGRGRRRNHSDPPPLAYARG
jgi:GT2 family glycosyltransferase/2-polyprenyl-3-methyl-5-hydroxy-6-metoxy-1,4-benzoquinol methylase/glycosyltransferase involved in cell wall biosynthesis